MRTATPGGLADHSVSVGPPRWSLDSIYRGFDDPAYSGDVEKLDRAIQVGLQSDSPPVEFVERALDLAENLKTFAYASYSTDTTNPRYVEALNHLERFDAPLRRLRTRFRGALASDTGGMEAPDGGGPDYGYVLAEEARLGRLQLSEDQEELAADLAHSGAELWARLQEGLGATLASEWPAGGHKTVVQLRSLAHDPDRSVRMAAYEKELALWKQMEIPLAHAINGVKGFAITLDGRRGFESSLQRAVMENRVSPATFDRLIETCESALPILRRYLAHKAALLGRRSLAFYDLFAPVRREDRGSPAAAHAGRSFTFEQARDFVVSELRRFSEDLGAFAQSVFEGSWIDAEPRQSKVGGAYCVSFPVAGESRILCNFDGSIASVSTIAHEIGHAYHHDVIKDHRALLRQYPMTLAETASIFNELLVYRALARAADAGERVAAEEAFLQDATQVIVDILSRFRFEKELFTRRGDHELSPQELCEVMSQVQRETYGNALDPEALHPYMWAVKGHYYRHDLSFYNFPYAFGMFFSLAMAGEAERTPSGFSTRHRDMLSRTGSESVDSVVESLGLSATGEAFWESALAELESRVASFEGMEP